MPGGQGGGNGGNAGDGMPGGQGGDNAGNAGAAGSGGEGGAAGMGGAGAVGGNAGNAGAAGSGGEGGAAGMGGAGAVGGNGGNGGNGGTIDPPDPDPITLATFNIRVFGKTKREKPEIMSQLVSIVRSYDIVAIQEIKDASLETPGIFLDAINAAGGNTYDMRVSERTGQQPDDTSASDEQYAYYFDTTAVTARDDGQLFDDSTQDLFQREPFVAQFATVEGDFTFVLINVHTKPTEALAEIDALHDVIGWSQLAYPAEDDFIALGDFNAGCDYASPEELDLLDIRGDDYVWLIPDTADTNLAGRECAYDRIVGTEPVADHFTDVWGVDEAFVDAAVSDHWPVWVELTPTE